ncbi:L,D-transpeptidase [Candidatus Parcubacteria bacterium]|nr:L,D-transpeptidase [Candidatus Parcubacteria bacterium]
MVALRKPALVFALGTAGAVAAAALFAFGFGGAAFFRARSDLAATIPLAVPIVSLVPAEVETTQRDIPALAPAVLPEAPRAYPDVPTSYEQSLSEHDIVTVRDFLVGYGANFVEIDLGVQTMTAWERGSVLWTSRISTGRKDKPTRAGVWKVLDKLDVAWGSAYDDGSAQVWKMPYWLGIYYAGASENGIHELPFINGVREGERSLGRAVSHGCVRVPKGTAKTLFDWVQVGTPVVIHH